MKIYSFIYFLILFEIVALSLLIVLVQVRRVVLYFYKKKEDRIRSFLTQTVLNAMQQNINIFIPDSFFSYKICLKILEEFNMSFKGEEWEKIKQVAAKKYLFPKAEKWVNSPFWTRRNVAVRTFILAPSINEEKFFIKLMNDSRFITKMIAANGAVLIASKAGIIKLLTMINKESNYLTYYYRDLLIQGNDQVISILFEECKLKKKETYLACLEVLGGKAINKSLGFIEEGLKDEDDMIRLATIKALNMNPLPHMEKILLVALEDKKEIIRFEAIKESVNFVTEKICRSLEQIFLHDESLEVRLEAAKTLKILGEEKSKILNMQSKEADKINYEIAQYALLFD